MNIKLYKTTHYTTKTIVILTIVFFTLASCKDKSILYTDLLLANQIEKEFNVAADITNLSNLNSFEWNELIILEPYSQIELVEKELQINLKPIRENSIEYIDAINLFIFFKDKKLIKIAEVSRVTGDFKNLKQFIKKESAKFIKNQDGQNKLVQ